MSFLEEAKELKNYLLSWLIVFFITSSLIFTLGFAKTEIFERDIYLPIFSSHSLAVMFFEAVTRDLVPEGVSLIATSPTSAFFSQMVIAFLGALILTFPLLLYKISRYLSPALYAREKRVVFKLLVPTTFLFLSGAIFAYFFLIPPTFKLLYSFNVVLGVAPFFAVTEFISWTLALMIATGIIFLLPIFMYLLSLLGVVPPHLWNEHWRSALITFLVISAMITPDGTGVTMILLSLPMALLYGAGIGLSLTTAGR